jgi:excinuclease ABC A subunit
MFQGCIEELAESGTVTAAYLNRRAKTAKSPRRPKGFIPLTGACANNLKDVSVDIPTGVLLAVTGVAGSGKSSLIHQVFCQRHPECVVVDQSPAGRNSRSNPMTYVGIFNAVRQTFADLSGLPSAYFSFNSKGACSKCKGLGSVKVEMSFLDDVTMVCDACQGKRYTEEVLKHRYQGRNIYDVLKMTVAEAAGLFSGREVRRKLKILEDVGLDYLELGQPLSTLSGGEAQRIKLAAELHKKGHIYVMDEPTTGLHLADIERLTGIMEHLVERGNTVIVIEHNLEVIARADWIIDLGPEGGRLGGEVLYSGPPQGLTTVETSHTGRYLRNVFTS